MSIRVVYHDNTHDLISVYVLQLGIECRKIKMFYRDSEKRWVTVGVDPVRKGREIFYKGPERRVVGKSVEATIPAHISNF
ncbi:MAG TPA: hypothetical protein VMB78_07145 [Dissulfurispiraceae bacterium]|nr:hypothetical protein [Dissulfurispiraceae bacterium]